MNFFRCLVNNWIKFFNWNQWRKNSFCSWLSDSTLFRFNGKESEIKFTQRGVLGHWNDKRWMVDMLTFRVLNLSLVLLVLRIASPQDAFIDVGSLCALGLCSISPERRSHRNENKKFLESCKLTVFLHC